MLNQSGILSLKLIFDNKYIDTQREAGCALTSNNIKHTNWYDYIWGVV